MDPAQMEVFQGLDPMPMGKKVRSGKLLTRIDAGRGGLVPLLLEDYQDAQQRASAKATSENDHSSSPQHDLEAEWEFGWEACEVADLEPFDIVLDDLSAGGRAETIRSGVYPDKLVRSWRWVDERTWPKGSNVFISMKQSKPYAVTDKETGALCYYEPTKAFLHATFSPVDGVMIIMDRVSPSQALRASGVKASTPKIGGKMAFSHLLWWVWDRLHESMTYNDPRLGKEIGSWFWRCCNEFNLQPGDKYNMYNSDAATDISKAKNWLNWVIIADIKDRDDLRAILACLKSRSLPEHHVPTWREGGERFFLGDPYFCALLALRCSSDFIWSLIEHKEPKGIGFGHKIIKSITIFRPKPPVRLIDPDLSFVSGNHCDYPALLFEVLDCDSMKKAQVERIREHVRTTEATYWNEELKDYHGLWT